MRLLLHTLQNYAQERAPYRQLDVLTWHCNEEEMLHTPYVKTFYCPNLFSIFFI